MSGFWIVLFCFVLLGGFGLVSFRVLFLLGCFFEGLGGFAGLFLVGSKMVRKAWEEKKQQTGLWLRHIISWSGHHLYVTLNRSLREKSENGVSMTSLSKPSLTPSDRKP